MYLNEGLIYAWQRLWFVHFFFFLICIRDFSRVFQHYQACQVDHDIIFFLTNKIECFADL